MLWRRSSLGLSVAEEGVELVERVARVCDALEIVVEGRADARQHRANPGSLGARELAVGDVELVNDFADRGEAGIGRERGMQNDGFETAAVGLMGELGIRHVEAELAWRR